MTIDYLLHKARFLLFHLLMAEVLRRYGLTQSKVSLHSTPHVSVVINIFNLGDNDHHQVEYPPLWAHTIRLGLPWKY